MVTVAILGFGVVGSGTAEVLTKNKDIISEKTGADIKIKYILDLRDFPDSPFACAVVHDFDTILNDDEVDIIVETMGGAHPAYDFSKAALLAGKHVVTSNKLVVAEFGTELLKLAKENGVRYLFEASVGGGIPVIKPMISELTQNKIGRVAGILNGTTNYILTRMTEGGVSFSDALKEAQKNGYAEADPTADIEGHDAARKTVILAAIATKKLISPSKIHTEGITSITAKDVSVAASAGYSIKLIGYAENTEKGIVAFVSPRLVPLENPLHGISGVFNGILVGCDMLGDVMFYGQGAGKLPTASAVVSDIIDIAVNLGRSDGIISAKWDDALDEDLLSFSDYACRQYFRLEGGLKEIENLLSDDKAKVLYQDGGEVALISSVMTEQKAREIEDKLSLAKIKLLNRIRVL